MTADPDDRRRPRDSLLQLLPALAFAATFGVFAVDKNREARTVLGSGRGLLALAVVVAAYAAVSLALRRGGSPPSSWPGSSSAWPPGSCGRTTSTRRSTAA